MSVIELEEYNNGTILKKLKKEEDCPKMLLTIVEFALSNMIQNLMHQLDSEFQSKTWTSSISSNTIVNSCFKLF